MSAKNQEVPDEKQGINFACFIKDITVLLARVHLGGLLGGLKHPLQNFTMNKLGSF